jgi:tetratricopeptide (TPR) repeat protein
VLNSLKVLDLLATYATLETEHFIIKFDRGQDELLARYAAKYLEEEVYPSLCKQFAFKPEGKTLFEIFNRAQNTSGHGWFSARMVGLPFIGTVGACAGKVVGMASPNGMDDPFNWARVLKHEFVHVLNLQQTNFNIPHWFTEALAVLNEDSPRPESWDRLLASRVPKGEVFNLDNINFGFIRPGSSDDWHMAYCQAELYAEYMQHKYGADSLAKMLAAYADNLSTPAALKRFFNVEQAAFEKDYLEYIKKIAGEISLGPAAEPEMDFADLQAAAEKDPKNHDLRARLANAQLDRKQYAQARRLAEAVLEARPKHQLASYVLARVRLLIGEEKEALALLENCLDKAVPNDKVLTLLATMKLKAGDTAGAEKLYEIGHKAHPHDSKWLKALASLYLKNEETEKLADLLARLADKDTDQFRYRKKLAELALDKKDFAAVLKWANQANQINVMDADVHRLLATALDASGRSREAVEEYEVIVRLKPDDLNARLLWAKACLKAKKPDDARKVLEKLIEMDADHPGAKELLEQINRAKR